MIHFIVEAALLAYSGFIGGCLLKQLPCADGNEVGEGAEIGSYSKCVL